MPTDVSVGDVEARIEPDLQEALLEVIDRVCDSDYTGKNGDTGVTVKNAPGSAGRSKDGPKLSGLAAFRGSGQHYRLPGTLKHDRRWEIAGLGERRSGRRPTSSPNGREPMSPEAEARELQLPEITETKLPDEATLRLWNQESQEAYWNQRDNYWSRPIWTAAEMQDACRARKLFPGLSPGCGYLHGPGKRYLKDRLLRYDFCPSQLTPAELRTEEEAAAIRRANKKSGKVNRNRNRGTPRGSDSDDDDEDSDDDEMEMQYIIQPESDAEISDSDEDDYNGGWPMTVTAFSRGVTASADGRRPSGFPRPLEHLPKHLPCGTKNMLVVGGITGNQHMTGQQLPNMSKNMPDEVEFGAWTRESQEGLWRQRRAYYTNRLRLSEAQRECRLKNLWPGGDKPYVVDRLLRFECCKSLLTPADTQTHESMTDAASTEFPIGSQIRMLFADGDTEEWFSGKVNRVANLPAERRAGATESFQLKLPHVDVRFPDGSVERAVPLLVDDQINEELRVETDMDYICDMLSQLIKRVERQARRDERQDRIQAKADAKKAILMEAQEGKWLLIWRELQTMGWTRRTPSKGVEYFLPMAPAGGRPREVKLGRDYFASKEQVIAMLQGKREHELSFDEAVETLSRVEDNLSPGIGRGNQQTPSWSSTIHGCVAAIPEPRQPPRAPDPVFDLEAQQAMSPDSQAVADVGAVANHILNWLYQEFKEETRVRMLFANKNSEMVWYSGKIFRVKSATTTGAGRKAAKGRKYPHADVVFDDGSFERGVPLLTRVNQHTLPSPNPELRLETDMDFVCDCINELILQVESEVAPITSAITVKSMGTTANQSRQCRECGGWGHFAKTCPLNKSYKALPEPKKKGPQLSNPLGLVPYQREAEPRPERGLPQRPPPMHPPRAIRDPNSHCKACRGAHTKHTCGRQKGPSEAKPREIPLLDRAVIASVGPSHEQLQASAAAAVAEHSRVLAAQERPPVLPGQTPQRQCRLCGGFGHFAKTCKLGAGEWKDRVHKKLPTPPVASSDRMWTTEEVAQLRIMASDPSMVDNAGMDYWAQVATRLGTQRSAFACQQYYLSNSSPENDDRVSKQYVPPEVIGLMNKLCEKVEEIQFICAKCGLPKSTRRGWCQSRVCVQRRANLARGGVALDDHGNIAMDVDYEASVKLMKAQDHKGKKDPNAIWLGNDPLRPRAHLDCETGKPVLHEPIAPPEAVRQEARGRPVGSGKKRKAEDDGYIVGGGIPGSGGAVVFGEGGVPLPSSAPHGVPLLQSSSAADSAAAMAAGDGGGGFLMEAAEAALKRQKKLPGPQRGQKTAFNFWVAEVKETIKSQNPGINSTRGGLSALLGERWKALSAAEKAPYDQMRDDSVAEAAAAAGVPLLSAPVAAPEAAAALTGRSLDGLAARPAGVAGATPRMPAGGMLGGAMHFGHLPPAPPPSLGMSEDAEAAKRAAAAVASAANALSTQQRAMVYQQQQAALQAAMNPMPSPTIPSPRGFDDEDARFGAPVDEAETPRRAEEALEHEREEKRRVAQQAALAQQQEQQRRRRQQQQMQMQQAASAPGGQASRQERSEAQDPSRKKGWATGASSTLPPCLACRGAHKKHTCGKGKDGNGRSAAEQPDPADGLPKKRGPGRPKKDRSVQPVVKVAPPPVVKVQPVPADPPTWARDGARSSSRSVKQVTAYDPEAEASKPQW